MSDAPAIAVLHPNLKTGLLRGPKLRDVALSDCIWPLGRPDHARGQRLADLASTDQVIGFAQNLSPRGPSKGIAAQVSLVLAEPAAIHASYQARVQRNAAKFHRILSYNDALLAAVPNGIFFPYGSTWVPDWKTRDLTKSRLCSLIASAKKSQPGHVLRHEVAAWVQRAGHDVDCLGHGYAPFADKADGLAPYRYSIVIENVQERHCFTEKLIDAILCDTVPIYWGCPNLSDYFDTSGIVQCHSLEDVQAAITAMSPDDYDARLPQLRAAKTQATAYADFYKRAALAVRDDGPVPPL